MQEEARLMSDAVLYVLAPKETVSAITDTTNVYL